MEKNIEITVTETKSVDSVSCEELYFSLRDTFRIIEELNVLYKNDADFGKNVKILLEYIM